MEYLTKLYDSFCVTTVQYEDAEKIRKQLSGSLDPEQRKLLLAYADTLYAYCDETSYRSFVVGFRLAAGLAAELHQDQTQAPAAAE